jgi:hypothetical protein
MQAHALKSVLPALALAVAAPLAHAVGVTNGDFETGDLSGWTVTGGGVFTGVDAPSAHGGTYGAYFGEDSPGSSIAQFIATTPGASYVVSFWLQLDDSAVPSSFSWSWDGAAQALLTNSPGFGYTLFSTTVTATFAATPLWFSFTNPNSFWLLDDVSVTPVPEPAACALFVGGALLLAARARRRSR